MICGPCIFYGPRTTLLAPENQNDYMSELMKETYVMQGSSSWPCNIGHVRGERFLSYWQEELEDPDTPISKCVNAYMDLAKKEPCQECGQKRDPDDEVPYCLKCQRRHQAKHWGIHKHELCAGPIKQCVNCGEFESFVKAGFPCDPTKIEDDRVSCCECGKDYEKSDLIRGHIYCGQCRYAMRAVS